MNSLELTQAVINKALSEGADLIGVAPVSRYEGAPSKLKPQAHLPEAKTVLVMAVHHPDGSVNFGAEPNSNFSAGFQVGMIPKLDTLSLRLGRFIEKLGYTAMPMSCTYYWRHRKYKDVEYDHAASFNHMNAFLAAGLGEYGWHGMVLSPKYGPRQRIVSVITDAPLIADPMYDGEKLCDRCMQCAKACWGDNYRKDNLLTPEAVSFTIDGKTFEHANINRWRCFWGEQCHLDMNLLAEKKNLKEDDLYEAIKTGTVRTGIGNAGYMCSSFKYCMSKPVRVWDKSKAPNPLRKKPVPSDTWGDLKLKLLQKARAVGADRISIRPISAFEKLKPEFYDGFRVDDFYKTFKWVISIGRAIPAYLEKEVQLASKNLQSVEVLTCGRMMIGTLDIARFLDDKGHEAIQDWWLSGISPLASQLSGWDAMWHTRDNTEHNFAHDVDGAGLEHPKVVVQSVVTNAPLEEMVEELLCPLDGLAEQDILKIDNGCLENVDIAGVAKIDSLPEKERADLLAVMPKAKSLIVLGTELPKRAVELAAAQEAECGVSYNFINYQALREAFWAAQDIAHAYSLKGFAAEPLCEIDVESWPRKTPLGGLPDLRAQAVFAAAGGLGFVARNGFIINPKFGPRLRFAFVLTEADLPESERIEGQCPDGCRLCADACPVNALNIAKISDDNGSFTRNDVACRWALDLGMTEEAGTTMAGWKIPDLPIPEKLDDETIKNALAQKDPIQVLGYQRPNQADTQVERCMQVCPFARDMAEKER